MEESKREGSALKVIPGVEQPEIVNRDIIARLKKRKRKVQPASYYVDGILKQDRTILSQAITLVESTRNDHQVLAQEIIEKCLPYTGNSIRIGITGVPGVGKSTFIEALGKQITTAGNKLAVLAIDPSSERTKGSILGDKTRMENLANDENSFIRPSPSAGSLGGVARKTRETIMLCEAAGYNTIFIETVGVGQSETAVHSMVDFFLLLMLAGAGDELQGIKRGIMEMADSIAITKADGQNKQKANLAKAQYQNALHLFPPTASGWKPNVLTCSSLKNENIGDVWSNILDYKNFTTENKFFENRRREQAKYWIYESINETLRNNFYNNETIASELPVIENLVTSDKLSSFQAAKTLLDKYYSL